MIIEENKIFNLMVTNGRRNDVANVLKGYLLILDDLTKYKCDTWDNIPKSLSQYYFYKEAISMFPDVFKSIHHMIIYLQVLIKCQNLKKH